MGVGVPLRRPELGGPVSSVWWGGGELAVGPADEPPAALVDRPMMGPADQGEVVQIRRPAGQPVPDVMALAPGQRPRAAWEHAAAVANG